jgi:hypothetical protein
MVRATVESTPSLLKQVIGAGVSVNRRSTGVDPS